LRRALRTTSAAALLLLAGATGAQAGPPGKWTQVTGIGGQPDRNILEVGLARTGDGVLHVLWSREGAGITGSLLHSSISANAKTVSGPDTVFTNALGGINESSALVATPEGQLRAFFAGTNVFSDAMATATSVDGKTWSAPSTASLGGNQSKPVYAATGIAAGGRPTAPSSPPGAARPPAARASTAG
jgi:hypothetical protein